MRKFLPVIGMVLLLVASRMMAAEPAKYTFAVVPLYNPSQLHREWAPLLQRLSRDTGIRLELQMFSSMSQFEEKLKQGAFDFAYLNPYQVVLSQADQAYIPLLKDAQPLLGILLTRRDSGIQSPRDLNGKTIAFPASNAFAASLYLRALLTEEQGIQFTPRYLGTHPNVLRHVARGEVVAGGSVNSALNDDLPEVRELLQIIYQTPGVAAQPVVVHPRVSTQVRDKFKQGFFALSKDEAGRALLKDIRISQPVLASYAKDYQSLEALKLQKYLIVESK